jgi:hypothetical protein
MIRLRELRVLVFIACLLSLILLWGLVSASAGLFLDGTLLSFEQPVPVTVVKPSYVTLHFVGRSAFPIKVHITKKLICDTYALTVPDVRSHISAGPIDRELEIFTTLISREDCGVCRVEGMMTYQIAGLIWPLSYEFESERFEPVGE